MIKIQKKEFNIEKEIKIIKDQYSNVGAVNTFVGYVRDINNNRDVKFLDLENAYGDKFLSCPLFPREADVAEYINLILFSRQNLKTELVPIVFDSMHSFIFKKL